MAFAIYTLYAHKLWSVKISGKHKKYIRYIMSAQIFHRFPDLPRELRHEIWRQCLPHRVVELDLPDRDYLEWWFEGRYGQLYSDLDKQRRRPCELWLTSWRNCAPPAITRVCHEARKIAFETAGLTLPDHNSSESVIPDDRLSWADCTRDTVHSHWHPRLSQPVESGIVQHRLGLGSKFHNASICADLLDPVYRQVRREVMDWLVKRPSWSICGAYVCIHATDEDAINKSGLWGPLGEERIVLVDARDTKRVASFRSFWQAQGTKEDVDTKVFFEACVDDVPKIHNMETPAEFLQDLQIRWLHDHMPRQGENVDVEALQREVWVMTPADFDGKEDDPRQIDYGELPGRPFARQLWSPNHNHLWVQDILSKMPDVQPTIMFRLCANDCLSREWDVDKDDD